jgi:hypothetical protein
MMRNSFEVIRALRQIGSPRSIRPWKSPRAMKAVGLTAIAGCCLLVAPCSTVAQSSRSAPSASAVDSVRAPSIYAALWQNVDHNQSDAQPQGAQAGEGQSSALGQAAASSQEPSLKDLGFPPSLTQGNAQEQARLDRRSHMLQIHQRLGLIAAAPMLAALITGPGAKGRHGTPGSPSRRDLHAALGATTAGLYFSSAYFAIRAPKISGIEVKGPIRLHKALAYIHGPGMILTPILGIIAYNQLSRGERVHGIAKIHSDVAWVTAAAYAGAILSVSFKF